MHPVARNGLGIWRARGVSPPLVFRRQGLTTPARRYGKGAAKCSAKCAARPSAVRGQAPARLGGFGCLDDGGAAVTTAGTRPTLRRSCSVECMANGHAPPTGKANGHAPASTP